MMHYRKGENVEKQLTKQELPFKDFLHKDSEFLWMHVNGGTKVNNVISYAKNALNKREHKHIIWSGKGGGIVKTISCAEILKRSYPLYQVTRMCYTIVEEHWKPQMDGLEEIVANRQIPSIHIFMSLEAIGDNVNGLQKPNTKTEFWAYNVANCLTNNSHEGTNKRQMKIKPNRNKYCQKNLSIIQNNQNCSSSGDNQQKKSHNDQQQKLSSHDRTT